MLPILSFSRTLCRYWSKRQGMLVCCSASHSTQPEGTQEFVKKKQSPPVSGVAQDSTSSHVEVASWHPRGSGSAAVSRHHSPFANQISRPVMVEQSFRSLHSSGVTVLQVRSPSM
jgi:hypothetical protein